MSAGGGIILLILVFSIIEGINVFIPKASQSSTQVNQPSQAQISMAEPEIPANRLQRFGNLSIMKSGLYHRW